LVWIDECLKNVWVLLEVNEVYKDIHRWMQDAQRLGDFHPTDWVIDVQAKEQEGGGAARKKMGHTMHAVAHCIYVYYKQHQIIG